MNDNVQNFLIQYFVYAFEKEKSDKSFNTKIRNYCHRHLSNLFKF